MPALRSANKAAPKPTDWFATRDLMTPAEFDNIKNKATRAMLFQKLSLLDVPTNKRNQHEILCSKLREYLVDHYAPPSGDIVLPESPPTKKRQKPIEEAPRARKKTRSLPPTDTDEDDDGDLVSSREVTNSFLLSGFKRFASALMISDNSSSNNYLSGSVQWVDFDALGQDQFILLPSSMFQSSGNRYSDDDEFLTLDHLLTVGYYVFQIMEAVHGTRGNGKKLNFIRIQYVEWNPPTLHFGVLSHPLDQVPFNTEFQFKDVNCQFVTLKSYLELDYKKKFHLKIQNVQQIGSQNIQQPAVQDASGSMQHCIETVSSPSGSSRPPAKSVPYDFDGKSLTYINKLTDFSSKLKEGRIAWRITDSEVYSIINQSKGDLDFSISESFSVLTSYGNLHLAPSLGSDNLNNSILNNTNRYQSLLHTLPNLVTNSKVYSDLLLNGWATTASGTFTYSQTVSLTCFVSNPTLFHSKTTQLNSFGDRIQLVEALQNLEKFFVFAFGNSYTSMCIDLIESLQYKDWSDAKWDLGYIRYQIESMLNTIISLEIKTVPKQRYFAAHQIDISNSIGVSQLLKQRFSNLKPSSESSLNFQRILSDPNIRRRIFGEPAPAFAKPTAHTSKDTAQNAAPKMWCIYDVYRQAGLRNSKTKQAYECTNGSNCKFIHGDFLSLPEKEQSEHIVRWTTTNNRGFSRTTTQQAAALANKLEKIRGTSRKSH